MNNNMEIQREAIIEIVGTQYEGRALNHNNLSVDQKLKIKHQKNNDHDPNAVIVLDENDKELGFLPKGYASIYAPAIDSGRYSFAVEIVKTEPDPERPILIVKITSELQNHNEEDIESDIFGFVQNIVNGYAQRTNEYLTFINSTTVNVDELLSALNRARLIQKLYSCSSDIIKSRDMKQNSEKYITLTKNSLIKHISELKADISDILKKIQKAYNESLDIDDEEEYQRAQSEIRERRKKFRLYDAMLTSMIDIVTYHVNVSIKETSNIPEANESEHTKAIAEDKYTSTTNDLVTAESIQTIMPQPEHETTSHDNPQSTEQKFYNWLIAEEKLSQEISEKYLSAINSADELYFKIFGTKKKIFDCKSQLDLSSTIEILISRREFEKADKKEAGELTKALNAFAKYSNAQINLKMTFDKSEKELQDKVDTESEQIINLNTPYTYSNCRPCYFYFFGEQHIVKNHRDLYRTFLRLLNANLNYRSILQDQIGKSLGGNCVDFASVPYSPDLRDPIFIAENFYAEGGLSLANFLVRIKQLMNLCNIKDDQMVIYFVKKHSKNTKKGSENNDIKSLIKNQLPEKATMGSKTPTDSSKEESLKPENTNIKLSNDNVIKEQSVNTSFTPDTTKPFDLKNAIIEILSSDAPEITKFRENKNGISTISMHKLIKEYYGKNVNLFNVSSLMIKDDDFKSVGNTCYVLNESAFCDKNESEYNVPVSEQKDNKELVEISEDSLYDLYSKSSTNDENETKDTIRSVPKKDKQFGAILDVIKENSDNLQYEDGFGAYEVKNLLANKGITDLSEEQIEELMSDCPELQEVEDGYYALIQEDNTEDVVTEQAAVIDDKSVAEAIDSKMLTVNTEELHEVDPDVSHIVLKINGKVIRAYDYSDALNKVCEFSINCQPFKMARIAGQAIMIQGKNVFYRKAVPVDGYNKLSNGLQVISIDSSTKLQVITDEIKKYCQIDDDMITIISL